LFYYFYFPRDNHQMMLKSNEITEDEYPCMMFINKIISSEIMRMFIFFYNFYIYLFYFVRQVLCICTDDRGGFGMRNIFFLFKWFYFYLIIWWGIGIASESKLEVLKDRWFGSHNCFYYFLSFCLIILFYYYSNIPNMGE
jgi:hypothetical protein